MSNEANTNTPPPTTDHLQFPPSAPVQQGYQATGQQQQQPIQWNPFLVQPGMRPSYPQRAPVMYPELWSNYAPAGGYSNYPVPVYPYPTAGIPVGYSPSHVYNPNFGHPVGPDHPNSYQQQMPMPMPPAATTSQQQNNPGPGHIGFDPASAVNPANQQQMRMPMPNLEPQIGWNLRTVGGQTTYQLIYQNQAPYPQPQQNYQGLQSSAGNVAPGPGGQGQQSLEPGFYAHPGYQSYQVPMSHLIPGPSQNAAYFSAPPVGCFVYYMATPGAIPVNYSDGPSDPAAETIEVSYCEDEPDSPLDTRQQQEESPTPSQMEMEDYDAESNLAAVKVEETGANTEEEIDVERNTPDPDSDSWGETESVILRRQAAVEPCDEQVENIGAPLSPPPPPPPMLLSNIVPIPAENTQARSNLLEQIREGVQLNSVDSRKREAELKSSKSFSAGDGGEKEDEPAGNVNLRAVLQRALSERYRVNHDDHDDDNDEDTAELDWVE